MSKSYSFDNRYLTKQIERSVIQNLTESLQPDVLHFEKNLSIIMIVGEDMNEHIGVTARAANALAKAGINIEMLSQGSSEVSVMFIVKSDQEKAAIKALYGAFFQDWTYFNVMSKDFFVAIFQNHRKNKTN